MGLRLVTPDGRRITRLSRWVLRCTACFLVTKEMGRLFCPRCGNASLDKVQLVVGPDGAEQYGVRRKHILRGTRFSLPKPKVKSAAGDKG
jgi:RNA-binding protein NOB1